MIDKKRVEIAKRNFDRFLREGLIKKERNKTAFITCMKNSDLSLKVAEKLMKDGELNPYLWIVVCSYYSMFYIANAVLLKLGYKVGREIVHKVTNEALINLVLNKLKKELLEEYEELMEEALSIASSKAEEIIKSYEYERKKRSWFQYEVSEDIKKKRAETSFRRAKKFVFEMKKLLRGNLNEG